MKIYSLNGEIKWYKRFKIYMPLITFFIVNIIAIPFFYFILGDRSNLIRAIITSLVISLLITFDYIYTKVITYEKKTIVIKNKQIYLIVIQKETDFYGTDAKRKIDIDFNNKDEINDIIENHDKYLGIAIHKADKYDIIKEKKDKLIVRLYGIYTRWKYKEEKKNVLFKLVNKNRNIKLIIDNKYNGYEELIKYIKKKEK